MFPFSGTVHYEFPNANNQKVTCNGGGKSTSWFDIIDIPVTDREPDNPSGIDSSCKKIHDLITKVSTEQNIPYNKIILGGFSQGGAMSLIAGSTFPHSLGGVVSLSGWLLRKDVNVNGWGKTHSKTPMFIGHGDADNVVLHSLGEEAASRIKTERDKEGGSGPVIFAVYKGEGHGACQEEIDDLGKFFRGIVEG